ncbi:hypothetical protein M433DRAFT_10107 [Acidomyces richmondensis BFW]|nr:hypothetical protein M433DRAFT_10455 [Acidomyces richmondensis BFW]KYG39720.1 hypothetical protein M433DRAFT_10107 [Acidomyces richmondensis BFW]
MHDPEDPTHTNVHPDSQTARQAGLEVLEIARQAEEGGAKAKGRKRRQQRSPSLATEDEILEGLPNDTSDSDSSCIQVAQR